MAESTDKYSDDAARRRFVKGVVGSAVLAGVGTAGSSVVNAATNESGTGGGTTSYYGVENIAGPAPRAMPQIPISIDDEGYLKGRFPADGETKLEIGGVTYGPEWFQYCGVQTYPGIRPGADQDNYFRYRSGQDSPADEIKYDWQGRDVAMEDRVHTDDFSDYKEWTNQYGTAGTGKPATATWRSQGVPSQETLPVEIIRSPIVEEQAQTDDWLAASTERGFIAHLNKCTHFCCVPGFKSSNYDEGAVTATDNIYCGCHQSIYDPFSIVERTFVALPRPE